MVSVKVDEETKEKMDALKDVNWSEVIRRSIRERIETEEMLRRRIDRARAEKASDDMEKIRAKTSGKWSGVGEIRKWRETRK